MLSIIIPALNEEEKLPLLLDSIKNQEFCDYEIIIADAGSADKTLEIAKKYGCIVVAGGLPAKGRNSGAEVASGKTFLFLDADTFLSDNFLQKSLVEYEKRNLGVASFNIKPYPKNEFVEFLVDVFYNKMMLFMEKILPHAAMGILVERNVFEKIKGFDESIKLAEDHDFARRAAKISKFGVIRSAFVFASDRRAKKDGWFLTSVKFLLCEIHMVLIGPVRSDIFRYRFGHYKENKNQ